MDEDSYCSMSKLRYKLLYRDDTVSVDESIALEVFTNSFEYDVNEANG